MFKEHLCLISQSNLKKILVQKKQKIIQNFAFGSELATIHKPCWMMKSQKYCLTSSRFCKVIFLFVFRSSCYICRHFKSSTLFLCSSKSLDGGRRDNVLPEDTSTRQGPKPWQLTFSWERDHSEPLLCSRLLLAFMYVKCFSWITEDQDFQQNFKRRNSVITLSFIDYI